MPDPLTIATLALSAQKAIADQNNQRTQFDAAQRRNLFSVFGGPRADAQQSAALVNNSLGTVSQGIAGALNQQQASDQNAFLKDLAKQRLDLRKQQAERQALSLTPSQAAPAQQPSLVVEQSPGAKGGTFTALVPTAPAPVPTTVNPTFSSLGLNVEGAAGVPLFQRRGAF